MEEGGREESAHTVTPASAFQGRWVGSDGETFTLKDCTLRRSDGTILDLILADDGTCSFQREGRAFRGQLLSEGQIAWNDGSAWVHERGLSGAEPCETAGPMEPAELQPGQQASAVGMIEVLVCHATQSVQVRVRLPKCAKFKHLKQALAKHLGNGDIQTRGLLTNKVGGVYKACKDETPIGNVRQVTVAGADFLSAAGSSMEVTVSEEEIILANDAVATTTIESRGPVCTATMASSGAPRPSLVSSRAPLKATHFGAKLGTKNPRITKRQAINLQRELYEAFKADEFQQRLEALANKPAAHVNTRKLQQERQELFLSVQSLILPKYGFEGTTSGVYQMMGAMGPFVGDPEFRQLASDINALLGIDSPPETWGSLSKSCQKLEATAACESREPAQRGPPLLMRMVSPSSSSGEALAASAGEPEREMRHSSVSGRILFDRWPIGKYQPFKLFIAGTWNDFHPAEMQWQNGLFVSPVTVGSNGWESFQILKDGSWNATIYPSIPDAGSFEHHSVCGPDDKGHGKNWQIGRFAEDQAAPGTQFAIVATVDKEGSVRLVHWQHLV